MIIPAPADEESTKIVYKKKVIPEHSPIVSTSNPTSPKDNNIPVPNTFTTKKPKRLYEIWPGNNRFYFDGRLMHGSSLRGIIILIFVKIVVSGVFFGVVTPYLVKWEIYYLPILAVVLLIVSTILMLLASCIDPGVIPRRELIKFINEKNGDHNTLENFVRPDKEIEEDPEQQKTFKFCPTCKIYRPPLCAHCLYHFLPLLNYIWQTKVSVTIVSRYLIITAQCWEIVWRNEI